MLYMSGNNISYPSLITQFEAFEFFKTIIQYNKPNGNVLLFDKMYTHCMGDISWLTNADT